MIENRIVVELPTKIVFAPGIINSISEFCSQYGNRLLFITNKTLLEKTEIADQIETKLKAHITGVLTYNTIDSTSDTNTVEEITMLAKEARVNLIVGLGGFTTLNIAKMVGILMSNHGLSTDYLSGKQLTKPSIPVITVPTIPGSLAEANNEIIITDALSEKKKLIKSKYIFPKLSLVDPELTLTVPPNFTNSTAISVLTNAIETYISLSASEFSNLFALRTVELIVNNALKLKSNPQSVDYRGAILMGGVLSSLGSCTTQAGIARLMSFELSKFNVNLQSILLSIFLPHIMEYNLTAATAKLVKICKISGGFTGDLSVIEAAIKAVEVIRKLQLNMELPIKLQELNIDSSMFPMVAKNVAASPQAAYSPRPMTEDEVLSILKSAY